MDTKYSFEFEVNVAFNFKLPNNTQIFSKTSVYHIVTDTKDKAMDAAIDLNKKEYGTITSYQYKGCGISKKTLVYVLNK